VGTAAIDTADQFGSTSDDGGATIIATGAASISCKRFHAKACTPSTMTVTLDGSTHTSAVNMLAGTLHHLTVNSSGTKTLITNTTVGGNLTITAGTLDTGSDKTLTVTGDVSVTGTLTGNASAITVGKMLEILGAGTYSATSGNTLINGQPDGDYILRVHDGGTFTHNSGTLTLSRSSASGGKYVKFDDETYNNITIDETNTSGTSTVYIVGVLNVAGDLTITDGEFSSYGGTGAIDVDGDVLISSGGILDLDAGGVNPTAEFGSLTIASGGTYSATGGTTTITGGNSASGYSFKADGTFTHNNGKMLFDFTPSQTWYTEANTYYDLELKYNNNTHSLSMTDDSGNAIKILNNLTVTAGMFEMHTTSDTLDIHGNTYINGGIFENASNHDTNKITHHGLVTINSGTYKINDGTTVKMNGGIRNMGTITVA